MRKAANRFWAGTAITLGVWEALAVGTKKVPTITVTARTARGRWNRRAQMVIAGWLFGLALHLFRD